MIIIQGSVDLLRAAGQDLLRPAAEQLAAFSPGESCGYGLLVVQSSVAGFAYGFAFGAGTFLSGLLAIGAMIGLVRWLPRRLFACGSRYRTAFVAVCALLLVALGTAQVAGGLA